MRIPNFYRPPHGLPLYWRDEVSGELPAAVGQYLAHRTDSGPAPSEKQLELLRDYFVHHINAPCWNDDEKGTLKKLRKLAPQITTSDDIAAYIHLAMEIALDPL